MLGVAQRTCNFSRWAKMAGAMMPGHIQGVQPIVCGPAVLYQASLRNYPNHIQVLDYYLQVASS